MKFILTFFTVNLRFGESSPGEFIRRELPTRHTTPCETERRAVNGQQLYSLKPL